MTDLAYVALTLAVFARGAQGVEAAVSGLDAAPLVVAAALLVDVFAALLAPEKF